MGFVLIFYIVAIITGIVMLVVTIHISRDSQQTPKEQEQIILAAEFPKRGFKPTLAYELDGGRILRNSFFVDADSRQIALFCSNGMTLKIMSFDSLLSCEIDRSIGGFRMSSAGSPYGLRQYFDHIWLVIHTKNADASTIRINLLQTQLDTADKMSQDALEYASKVKAAIDDIIAKRESLHL